MYLSTTKFVLFFLRSYRAYSAVIEMIEKTKSSLRCNKREGVTNIAKVVKNFTSLEFGYPTLQTHGNVVVTFIINLTFHLLLF